MASVKPAVRRIPLLAIGMVSMVCGVWLGLLRLGWTLPLERPDLVNAHGPLMVCGFLGTLIGLERAVALGASWGYAAPLFVAAGALALDVPAGPVGPLLITIGSGIVVAIYVATWRRQPSAFIVTMGAGAVAWTAGNVQWLGGAAISRVVFWWLAFLVLTIAGERLELNRLLRPSAVVRRTFIAVILLVIAGVVSITGWPASGVRLLGAGLLALSCWLLRYDMARRTVHQGGLTRFMAVCLLAGYTWLGVGGAIAAVTGTATPGLRYDALLHAVFLGFVMSMVFAHAPVIFPAVLGTPLPYRSTFYAHAAVLHASVLLRVLGDLVPGLGGWRAWGGMLNAVALLLFVVSMAWAIVASALGDVVHTIRVRADGPQSPSARPRSSL